jgi:hypothetical protein
LRSMYHESVSEEAFLSVKAKIAPPDAMADLRSAGEESEAEMRSKAVEEGKDSGRRGQRSVLYGLRWFMAGMRQPSMRLVRPWRIQ